jgi:hypothetical protein
VNTDGIAGQVHGEDAFIAFARRARGPHPGGVLSDADGRVVTNYLQQDLDEPPDPPYAPPAWAFPWRWPRA